MQLLKDRILVKPIIVENKTKSGLFIPGEKTKELKAEVVLIGLEVKHVKVGDKIQYTTRNVTEFEYNNEKHLILFEGLDVEAIL